MRPHRTVSFRIMAAVFAFVLDVCGLAIVMHGPAG